MWKIILAFMGKRKKQYVRAVKFRKEVFIITISKFVPVSEEISRWKDALKDIRASTEN